jgi:hypothetical protein
MADVRVGDRVSWGTSQGRTQGKVVERKTADFQFDGQPDGFPFGDIEDQKVITALDEESSCEDVINVF